MLGLLERLKKGLTKSKAQFGKLVDLAIGRGVFDAAAAEQLEEALILADVGPELSDRLVRRLDEWVRLAGGGVTTDTIREELALEIAQALTVPAVERPAGEPPAVTLLIGVNGSGKTTTAAKLAQQAAAAGRKVILGAADTFRAAAVDQLKIWGERIGCEVVAQAPGADPAAVAYDAVSAGIARRADEVIIDTAGRLHTKANLMNELEKVLRVTRKLREPREVLLVLDATTGQNGLLQVASFARALPLTGLVITKLDGSAKAGVVVQAVEKFKVPVKHVGVGETAEDFLAFDAKAFAEALFNG